MDPNAQEVWHFEWKWRTLNRAEIYALEPPCNGSVFCDELIQSSVFSAFCTVEDI